MSHQLKVFVLDKRQFNLLLRGQADQPRARVYGCALGAAAVGSAS